MSVYSFGLGVNGELGQGDVESQNLPKKIQFFSNINKKVKKIACGSYHTVFLTDDEEMYMTGISKDPKTGTTLFINLDQNNTIGKHGASSSGSSSGSSGSSNGSGGGSSPRSRIPHGLSTRSLLHPTTAANLELDKQLQSTIEEFQVISKTNTPPIGLTPPLVSQTPPSLQASTPPFGLQHSTSSNSNSSQKSQLATSIYPEPPDYVPPRTTPVRIPLAFLDKSPANSIKQVSLGNYHIVILTESGNIYSWGTNTFGQLGIGSTTHSNHPKLVELKCVKSIATGVKHTAAINEWGELYMWGLNEQGELGLGDTNNRFSPTRVTRLKSEFVTMVSCSSTHSVCVTDSGRLYTWGQSDKTGKVQTVPTLLLSPGDGTFEGDAEGGGCGGGGLIRQIACGEWLLAALTQMGEVFLWELGGRPAAVHHMLAHHSVRSIAMGNFHLLCLTDGGEVITLGRNKSGQLGRVVPGGEGANMPGMVTQLSHREGDDKAKELHHGLGDDEYVLQIHAGEYHSVALVDNTPKMKIALQFLKMQRNYLRQLNILNNVYYKSFMSIATPADPLITQLLALSNQQQPNTTTGAANGKTSILNQGFYGANNNEMAGGGGGGHISRSYDGREIPNGSATSPSLSGSLNVSGSAPIASSTSNSTPNLLSSNMTRSRSTSMATIRGILGLNAISNMANEENVAVTEEEVIGIFCDIRSLIRSTQLLLHRFDQRIDTYDPETKILGDIFLDEAILSSYRVYIPFSDNYNSACMTLFNVRKRSEKVATLLKDCEKRSQSYGVKLDHSLVQQIDLKSLLLSPLQNIPRIFMMLRELSMSTSPKHKDLDLLDQSAGKFQVLFERMNQNFQFVDAVEILNCSSNEYGNPQIMGGSLTQLVEKLTHHNISDPNFSNVFLLTFRSFAQPTQLLELLIEKYDKLPLARGKVINFISMWVVQYFYDFETDPIQTIIDPTDHHPKQLSDKLESFIKSHTEGIINSVRNQYENQRKKDVISRYNALSVILPQCITPPSISLLDYTAQEIGQTLTLLNHLYFSKIDKREFLHQRWTKKKAPNIETSTIHFNRISQLVVTEIIQCKNSKSRAAVIAHFIAVAHVCFELNNFTGVASIIYGLNNSTISKLKKTWSKLSKDSFGCFEYLEKIVTPVKNFPNFRHIMATIQPPCIPFLGVYLKDLTFIEDGNPSQIGGLINFYKQRKIAEVIFQISQFQQVTYTNISMNQPICDYILAAPLLEDKKAQSMASTYE